MLINQPRAIRPSFCLHPPWVWFFCLWTWAGAAHAETHVRTFGTAVDGKSPLSATLITDAVAVTPKDTLRIGLYVQMDPGWHIYWQQPGAAGIATQLQWQLQNATAGEVYWPAPSVFRENDDLVTYGYATETLLWSNVSVLDGNATSVQIKAKLSYLACNIICSPGQLEIEANLPIGQVTRPAETQSIALFERFAKTIPQAAQTQGWHAQLTTDVAQVHTGQTFNAKLTLTCIKPEGCQHAHWRREPFVPDAMPELDLHVIGARMHADHGTVGQLHFHAQLHDALPTTPAARPQLLGIVYLEDATGPWVPLQIALDFPIQIEATSPNVMPTLKQASVHFETAPQELARAPHNPVATADFWQGLTYLFLAYLGGLILNLMPCVLPVLGLKLLSLTQMQSQHTSNPQRLGHSAAYLTGVVATLWGLASVVLLLRYMGQAVGWGFQFQQPSFVMAVALIVFVFAMNCFGVFEINIHSSKLITTADTRIGIQRSFLDGFLAVVLATPCSAPFLGTAMAFALQANALWIYTLFLVMGVGLATPYLVLAWLARPMRFLPRAGAWMLILKHLMGFVLLITTVWLCWILGRMGGVDTMGTMLLVFLLCALGLYLFGYFTRWMPQHSLLGLLLVLVFFGLLGRWALQQSMLAHADNTSESLQLSSGHSWEPYTPEAVTQALAQKRPVFVDFTADWCLTCQYNEQHVLRAKNIVQAFQAHNVRLLRADWTQRDEKIRQTLARFGRAGVPMYLLFRPDAPNTPQLLPEILNAARLEDALGELD